ncbi:MAG TPA: PfkB family carbohydrate kinase [Candidatus Baltobacteraceae bacterium]|nr:PfkB family carbohydrate kinase [Candidatus Baltobacteraceae bacterium]
MGDKRKILELGDLAERVRALKLGGKVVVQCHGVFDLLHVGHIRHFQEAKSLGDVLVVTLTEDAHVNKGPHRPAFPDTLRAEQIAALDAVDFVAINRGPTAVPAIDAIAPDVYVKGQDYRRSGDDESGGILIEREAVERGGGRIEFTDDITFSSSTLVNRYLPSFSGEVEAYLEDFRRHYSARDVIDAIKSLESLRVVVVGEAIIDEYVYCEQMGKSAKEPVLAMRYTSRELFAGGSLAVANHAANFCKGVDLVTYLGDRDNYQSFIGERLHDNVRLHAVVKSNSPTIVKRRYVESYLLSKLFEVYEINDELLLPSESEALCDTLGTLLGDTDGVIVADFGHGLMTEAGIELLARDAPFLAVNTQINAANIGFHAISNYPRCDYVCIHEGEVRLDARSRRGELKQLAARLAERMSASSVLVTRGKRGATLFSKEADYSCPAFSTSVVDRIGSGDAVLAITSLCVRAGVDPKITAFVANVIGAQKVKIMGNRTAIDRLATIKTVESLLK